MADWQKIKTEYITTDTSYRKLAQKHGVSHVQIGNVGKQENWVELRRQHLDKTLTKTVDTISNKQVDRAANLVSVADILLAKVKSLLETDSAPMTTQSMRNISGVLRDIKEIQMIRSDADMREQEARIANLRKQAESEDGGTEVTVTFGSEDAQRWAK